MRTTFLTCLALTVAACSGNSTDSAVEIDELDSVTLRATADITLTTPITKATFLPKPVTAMDTGFSLNLPGEIILLSDTGNLWRTTTQGEIPLKIADGEFTDISGYVLEDGQGVILAITGSGSLAAYTKADDLGNFKRLTVSQGSATITAFCESGPIAVTDSGELQTFVVNFPGGGIAEISTSPLKGSPKDIASCHAANSPTLIIQAEKGKPDVWQKRDNEDWVKIPGSTDIARLSPISSTIYLGVMGETGAPVILEDDKLSQLEIADGLSIRGIDAANYITTTHAALGTTFSNGLILFADRQEPRLVMVSMEYAKRELVDQ